jgi:glycosyltransferase involved in cell wall biosynthesis
MDLIDENQEIDSLAPVSVIIPCYNCENTILRAVNSVVKQTWKPKELIIVNDGSQDNVQGILKKLQMEFGKDWIKVIQLEKNCGPGNARNKGWEIATQPYIAFLDADDAWHPGKIAIQLKYMLDNPDVAITGHPRKLIEENDLITNIKKVNNNYIVIILSKQNLLLKNYFSTSSVILKREINLRFQNGKRYSEDYLLWLQIILAGYKAVFLEEDLAYTFKVPYGEGGLSAKLWEMEKGELENYWTIWKLEKISIFEYIIFSVYSIIKFALRLIKKRHRFNNK